MELCHDIYLALNNRVMWYSLHFYVCIQIPRCVGAEVVVSLRSETPWLMLTQKSRILVMHK